MDFDDIGNAIGTIRQAYDLVAIMAKDAARFLGKPGKADLRRFHEVYMPEIQQKLEESVSAYVANFSAMEQHLTDARDPVAPDKVAADLARCNDRIWSVKATVEAKARAWIAPLPPASLERAYVWAVLNVYFGESAGSLDKASLLKRADEIAQQVSDEDLDTPNTRISERIQSGELQSRKDLSDMIRSEKNAIIARYKAAQRLYEEIGIGMS